MSSSRILEVMGSGEFEPWCRHADQRALSVARAGDGSVLIIPTGVAPEGPEALEATSRVGVEHFARRGVRSSVLPLRTREEAFSQDLVERVKSPSMIFFSGGHPEYLARTLADTPLWAAVADAWRAGVALAGCSAGAWIMGEMVPDSMATELTTHGWERGLGLVAETVFAPHWNSLDSFIPGLQAQVLSAVPDDHTLVAIDDLTAIVGDGRKWVVHGSGTVGVRRGTAFVTYGNGKEFVLPAA